MLNSTRATNVWENDPGSAIDWTYGGTTSVASVGNDGTNAVFRADTPDPADGLLAGTTFTDSGSADLNRPFCAAAGQDVTDIDVVLLNAAAQATLGGRISGPGDADESEVTVVLYRAAGDGSRGQFLGGVASGADGRYQLTAEGGRFVIDFVAPPAPAWANEHQ